MRDHDTLARCLAVVEERDRTLGWGLDQAERERYAAAIAGLVAPDDDGDALRAIALNYHGSHAQVRALREPHHPDYEREWASWVTQVVAVQRSKQLDWWGDGAQTDEDLAQVALAAMVAALPSYRFRSRFSSWAYSVVVQSVYRQIRDSRAAKRSGRPESLDQIAPSAQPAEPAGRAEDAASAQLLRERIAAVLGEQRDGRLARIFFLWAHEDRHIDDIASLLKLHPSRVRALLQSARQILRDHPEIRAWREPQAQ